MPHPTGHFVAIDASNMLHRAWAMSDLEPRPADGRPIGATRLFGRMLAKLLRRMDSGRQPPSHIALFFDPPRETSWRRAVSAAYKAHRPPLDPDLAVQIPMMQEVCHAMGLAWAVAEHHEADDMIAAYVEDGVENGMRCTIVSTDKDLMQLVRPRVLQLDTVRDTWVDAAAVTRKFGVPPERLADFLALAGDSVDGIPGVPGIGPKAAVDLLAEFGSLGTLLRAPERILQPGRRTAVSAHAAQARLSRKLVALDSVGAPRLLEWQEMRTPALPAALGGLRGIIEMDLDRSRSTPETAA